MFHVAHGTARLEGSKVGIKTRQQWIERLV